MNKIVAYIGLGSNLITPEAQIMAAKQAISALSHVHEGAFSSLYRSPPMGPQDRPDYVNAVMAIRTDLSPMQLLRCLQKIELDQGRVRKGERWGARTLDLDILLYGDQIIDLPELTIPHYGLTERAFVVYPLQEIAPDLIIPGKDTIADLVALCPLAGLEKIA